jgi:hypothetical protein
MKKSWLALSLSGLLGINLLPSLTLASEIEPGFDLFETPAYEVDLRPSIDLTVELVGNPEPLVSENLGRTDTIIERKTGINPFPIGADVPPVEIQVKVLSLKSVNPIDGSVLGLPVGTMIDLYVVINALGLPSLPLTNELTTHTGEMIAPSNGEITIKHDYDDGNIHPYGNVVEGTFESNLPNIQAFLIFVTAGKELSTDKNAWLHSQKHKIELGSTGWWSHEKPAGNWNNKKYPAGRFYIVSPGTNPDTGKAEPPIVHTGPHPVIVSPVIFDQPLTATLRSDNTVSLSWITGYEEEMAGFATYRGIAIDGNCSNSQISNFTNVMPLAWRWSGEGMPTASGLKYSVEINDANGNSGWCYGLLSTGYDGTWELYTVAVQ